MAALDPNSIEFLMLRHWGPPIATIVLGGLGASLIVPRLQSRRDRWKAINDRKIALYEAIADQFGRYVSSWRRLLSIAYLERSRPLSDLEQQRKQRFIDERYAARDSLFSEFAKARLYFSDDCCNRIDAFIAWDETHVNSTLDDLPDVVDWRRYEGDVIKCLGQDLRIV